MGGLGWSHSITCLKPCADCTGEKSGLGISIVNFSELGDICPKDFVSPSKDVQLLLLLEKMTLRASIVLVGENIS